VAGSAQASVLASVYEAHCQELVEVSLVGPAAKTAELAAQAQINLDALRLIDAPDNDAIVATACAELRDGRADLLKKGTVPTDELMRSVLDRKWALRTDRILSHVAVFECPGQRRLMLLTDAGVNIAPDLARKIEIIKNSLEVAAVLGIDKPKVAILAATEKSQNTSDPAVRDANLIAGMNRAGRFGDSIISGPLSLDLAVSPESAQRKGKADPVAGRADILIAHDINVGNALFKALQTWVGATIASVVVGAKVPLIVPSRADTADSKLASIALAVLLLNRGQRS